MKFIRNWIKKIIIESMKESFPPMNITAIADEDSGISLSIDNCFFRESRIAIRNNDKAKLSNCDVKFPSEGSFAESGDT